MISTRASKQIAFFALFIPAVVVSGLAFGWDRAWIGAAAVSVLWAAGDLLWAGLSTRRAAGSAGEGEPFDPDEFRGQTAEIQVEGTKRRYRAEFATEPSPVATQMSRDERRVAQALATLGFPPATVTAVSGPAEESTATQIIELPRELV
jgi:hypothetical protein